MEEVVVSIICLTYNHEKYIADALDSFIMQKACFKYEVLVHDDASTDNTREIIENYAERYPDVIKPYFQTENQYSKGNKRLILLNWERAKGKYIALCEGDDYWLDNEKLQKQVDYLENNPLCSLCVHATKRVSVDKLDMKQDIRPFHKGCIVPMENLIVYDDYGYIHTSSMIFPARLIDDLPEFYFNAPVGDYPLTIFLGLKGQVYYIDEFMSAYRNNTPGSWTDRILMNKDNFIQHNNQIINMLDEVNSFSNYNYDNAVKKAKKLVNFRILLSEGRFKEALGEDYLEFFNQLKPKYRYIIGIKGRYPIVTKIALKLKKTRKALENK